MNDNGRERRSYWWRAIFGSNYTFASICGCGNVKCLIKVGGEGGVGKAECGFIDGFGDLQVIHSGFQAISMSIIGSTVHRSGKENVYIRLWVESCSIVGVVSSVLCRCQ
jgi:hypothetical protein